MEQEETIFFRMMGKYTKMTKVLFDSLAKFATTNSVQQMDFHLLVNFQGIHYITKSKGSITSNVLKLSSQYFNQFSFQESKSNTASGFVMKVDMIDFDLAYKVLDVDLDFAIEYDDMKKKMIIIQNRDSQQGQYNVHKKIEISALYDDQ